MKIRLIGMLLASSLILSGCTGLIVAGAAGGVVSSQDRRTLPTQLEDQNIELKAIKAIFENQALWANTNIDVISYNNHVLLLGQAPTAELKNTASDEIKKIAKINVVHNQIRVAAPVSFFTSRKDEYITSKVKTAMLFTKDLPSSKIKVITENGEVFLMGLVSHNEADKAVEVARNIGGVKKVVKVFEYLSSATK